MAIEEEFEKAQKDILQAKSVGTSDLLALYALFKQSTAGDATGKRPGMMDVKGRAKFDAWAKLKGVQPADAMGQYVALVAKLLG